LPRAPAEPAIDTKHLARMTLGDERLEQEILQLFLCQAEMMLGRMANQPSNVIAALSHILVGSARGIGAWKVAAAAEALERFEKTPTVSPAVAMKRLAQAVNEARAAIGA